MKCEDNVEISYSMKDCSKLFKTDYDDLFRDVIRYRGIKYYMYSKVGEININDNTISAKAYLIICTQ